jgi:hypothetical protein
MKKKLLEYLIRECAEEMVNTFGIAEKEEKPKGVKRLLPKPLRGKEKTVGAPAPPAGGLGTNDTPPLEQPTATPLTGDEKTLPHPETPTTGLNLLNPKNTARVDKVNLRYVGDAQLQRDLKLLSNKIGGSNVLIPSQTVKMVKDYLIKYANTPAAPGLFLYYGKSFPESKEIVLLHDKNIEKARANSIDPHEVVSPVATQPVEPIPSADRETPEEEEPKSDEIDEETRNLFKKAIREALLELNRK